MSDKTDALPGFESYMPPCRPGECDMSDSQKFTGEVLFRDHPDVFKAVAAAIFIDGLSVRGTATRYRVSVNTVRAIRDMALESATNEAGRAAFFIKSKADKLKGIIRNRALEVILDRLSDPIRANSISLDTLMELATLDSKSPQVEPKHLGRDSEVIDVDEFDDVLNGLDGQKKNAAQNYGESVDKTDLTGGKNVPHATNIL